MSEELKAKARRLMEEGLNKGVMAVFDELLAPNYAYHNPVYPNVTDRESYKRFVTAIRTGYPDVHFTIEDLIAGEGDTVVMRWTFHGTDKGGSPAFGGPPTGKHVASTGITISRFAHGKLVEEWTEADYLGLSKQLQG